MRDARVEKYRTVDTVHSLVLVRAHRGSGAELTLLEKRRRKGRNFWVETLKCSAATGYNGTGKSAEGDGKTPTGDFGIITAFGVKDDPGTALPYIRITEGLYCCTDREYYNQIIDAAACGHRCGGEHLIEYVPQYNYAIFFDYNARREYGRGSAIFLHCAGDKEYTDGCVAISEENVKHLLSVLDIHSRIIIG